MLGTSQKRASIDEAIDRTSAVRCGPLRRRHSGTCHWPRPNLARSRGMRLYRLDNRAGISSAIIRLLETDYMVGKLMGHLRLKDVDIVAGGLLAQTGAVIVDDIRNPAVDLRRCRWQRPIQGAARAGGRRTCRLRPFAHADVGRTRVMNDQEIDIVLRRYTERLARARSCSRGAWLDEGTAQAPVPPSAAAWNLTTEQLLDFGCGFGDMYDYCREHLPQVSYQGFDLNPALVAAGRQRYPEAHLSAGIALRDGSARPVGRDRRFRTVQLSPDGQLGFIEAMFDLFARHARIGFAANFLSDRVDYRLDHTYHADPVKVLDLRTAYSNRVMLRNDYMPFEFTLYVDFRRDFDKTHVVYPEFMPYVDVDD